MADATTHIATQTVSGSSTTVLTFGSIPSSYDDLIMIGTGRCDSTAGAILYMDIVLNSDTGNNYLYGHAYAYGAGAGYGSSVESAVTAQWRTSSLPGATNSEDNPGAFYMYLPRYSSSSYEKTMLYTSGAVLNAANTASSNCHFKAWGLWTGTGAVNQIELKMLFGNWIAGSSYSLYGVSNS